VSCGSRRMKTVPIFSPRTNLPGPFFEKHANVFIGNGCDDLSNSSDSQGESVGGQTYGTDKKYWESRMLKMRSRLKNKCESRRTESRRNEWSRNESEVDEQQRETWLKNQEWRTSETWMSKT
jgi:hypothetical protein